MKRLLFFLFLASSAFGQQSMRYRASTNVMVAPTAANLRSANGFLGLGLAEVSSELGLDFSELTSVATIGASDFVVVHVVGTGPRLITRTNLAAIIGGGGGGGSGLGGVVVVNDDGTATTFLPAADTDGARGTALIAANGAAVAGDVIWTGPGTYDLGALGIALPDNVDMIMDAGSRIISTIALGTGVIVTMGTNSVIRGGTIEGTTDTTQSPLGFIASGTAKSGWVVIGTTLIADTDGFYVHNTTACTGVLRDCTFLCEYDAVAAFGTGAHRIDVYNPRIVVTGPSETGGNTSRGVICGANNGIVRVFGGSISVTDGGVVQNDGLYTENSGSIEAMDVAITVSNGASTKFDAKRLTGSIKLTGGIGSGTDGVYLTSGTITYTGSAHSASNLIAGTLPPARLSLTSAELATALTNETGTTLAVFNTSPVFNTNIDLASTGVRFTPGDGTLTIAGIGSGFDENLLFDFNTESNEIDLSSTTGATTLNLNFATLNRNASPVVARVDIDTATEFAGVMTEFTGSGNFVRDTSPTLVTPNLGTPSALTLSNATGLPISTGISGLGSNVATFLATPSFSNFNSATTGDDAAGLAAANAFSAQNAFTLSPRIARTDLGAGTALTIGTHYWVALSAIRTLTFSGTPADGDEISLQLTVTGGPHILTVPTSYRVGATSTTTTISLPTGNHLIRWLRIDARWVMTDSGVDAEAAYTFFANPTGSAAAPSFVATDTPADGEVLSWQTGNTLEWIAAAGGGDFSSNTATSVDSEVVLFSGTAGKTGKRATGTGIARLASGVLSSAELSGDVTTSGSNAATIANNAVTSAKINDGAVAGADVVAGLKTGIVGFTASDTAVATGKVKGFVVCPYAGTISGWSIVVDAGTATVKVWKIASGTAKPTVANVINTAGVAISSGTAVISTTTTDFTTTTVTADDIFAFDITAASGVAEITFQLKITKS